MKKRTGMKAAAVLLAVGMLAGGCADSGKPAGETATGQPPSTETSAAGNGESSGEPVTVTALSVWEISDVRPPKNETVVGEWIQDKINMKLELVTVPEEGLTTKVNTMIASKSLPTLLFKNSDKKGIADLNVLGGKGVVINAYDYEDKLPNFMAKLKENDYIRKELTASDGKIYGFPRLYFDDNIMYTSAIIRQDLLEGSPYSADKILTLNDLTNALIYLTEQNGNPAWIQRNGYSEFMQKSGMFFNLAPVVFYDYEKDAFTHMVLEDRSREYIEWLRTLRSKGVLHPDWAIMKDETWEGMLASNQGYFTIDRMNIIGDQDFSPDFDWQPVVYPEIDGKRYLQSKQSLVNLNTSWAINAGADPAAIEKALEFVDLAYSDEYYETLDIGVEGKTFTRENPNTLGGIRWLIQVYGENADDPGADLIYKHSPNVMCRQQQRLYMTSQPGPFPEAMYKHADNIINNCGGFRPDTPTVSFTDDVRTLLGTKETGLNTFVDENIIKFIEGKRSMDEWDSFAADVKAMGLEEILGYYSDAYAEYKAK